MAVLALIYLIADVLKFRKWGLFFMVFGMNALFSFVLAGMWTRIMLFIKFNAGGDKITLYKWLYEKIFAALAGNLNGSLMFALVQMLLIWLVALFLYRKKIYIRL